MQHGLAQGAIPNHQLDVHLGLAAKLCHALPERAPVDADGLAECVITVEYCPKFKWQDGGVAEAVTNYPCMRCRMMSNGPAWSTAQLS